MENTVRQRIESLRQFMASRGYSAVIVPQADPHMSEYLSAHWQLRRYLSGFTGSAGDLVVTRDKAALWTDSRYFLQASQQLEDSGIELMKDGLADTPSVDKWLAAQLKAGEVVAVDSMVFSAVAKADLQMRLKAEGLVLVTDFDADMVWPGRPALPDCKVFVHDVRYAGRAAADKIAEILERTAESKADSVFVSALDQIAWTLNIRANDVKYNPVATAFMYLSPVGCTLFVDPAKLDPDVTAYLGSQGVAVAPYTSVRDFLRNLPGEARVLVDGARTAAAIVELLGARAVVGASPVAMLQACKNAVQLDGVRSAMVRDGVAMVRSLCEICDKVSAGEALTEMGVAAILRHHRSQSPLFFDESFGTIAGYGPHGAIVHYEADEHSDAALAPRGLLLVDSGAQYLDGTTDITRTISLGQSPTAEEKRDFTLVMKGHIALASVVFPAGTCGAQLDAIARQFLWAEGLSYLHGTGHGVGHFLNVHEGPQSIRLNYVPTPLTPGMITSNEPGLYREGVHGIRCENLVLTVEAMHTEFGRFLRFETLTLCPFDLRLFDTSIMTNAEIAWVNAYHAEVAQALAPSLEGRPLEWLLANTRPLPLHKYC